MGKRRKRKSLMSLQLAIEDHEDKIARERTKSSPDENLIIFWQKEIQNLENRIVHINRQLTKHQRSGRRRHES